MPSFIITSINDENCGIPYKYNIKFVDEQCLQFCLWTVFNSVGELSSKCVSVNGPVGELSRIHFSIHPLRYLWVNDYKGKITSGLDHYIFCLSVMLGTACTA